MAVQVESQSNAINNFNKAPSTPAGVLGACIIGPNYQLVRYSNASEKSQGSLGSYDYTKEVCYSWPNLVSGGTVDLTYTKMFMDTALLQYFHDAVGSNDTIKAVYCDPSVSLVGSENIKNAIRGASTVWKTYESWDRDSRLYERDVQVGDAAHIEAVVGGTTYTLDTHVAGFKHEEVLGSVGTATEDPNNISEQFEEGSSSSSDVPASTWEKIGYATNDIAISAIDMTDDDRPEHSYEDGVAADIYTLEVISGGAPGSALISVTSTSGTDDVASVSITAFGAAISFGDKGLSVTFTGTDDFVVGMKWEVTVEWGTADLDVVSGGSYTGPSDTTYIVEVTKGGSFANLPEVTISTTTGIDSSGPTQVSGLDTSVSIGSYGVTLMFTSIVGGTNGLYYGDRFYVPATAASAGAIQTLLLDNNLSNELLGLGAGDVCGTPPDLDVTLYIEDDIEVTEDRTGYAPLTNWEAKAGSICLKAGIVAYDSSWVDSTDTLLPLQVKGGSAYVTYRALDVSDANKIMEVAAPAAGEGTLATYVETTLGLGKLVSDNPLALGVYLALLNAGEETVTYIPVETDDLSGYQKAFNRAGLASGVQKIVPLTMDATIQVAAQTHVDAMNIDVDGQWRSAMISVTGPSEKSLVTQTSAGGLVLATIKDDPDQSGVQFVLVETNSDVNFITSGVQSGDIVRAEYTTDGFGDTTYSEYVVSSVESETSLILAAGPDAAVSVAAKMEVWRNLTTDQMVDELVSKAAEYDNSLIDIIWPDYLPISGTNVNGCYLCAALAGLSSTILPNRSLEYIEILGFDSVARSTEVLSYDNLSTLRDGGVMVVYATGDDELYVRRAVTSSTSTSNIEDQEEMMVRNVNNIRHNIEAQVAPYKGAVNLIPSVVEQLKTEVIHITDKLNQSVATTRLGPQITGVAIDRIEQHPTLLNRLLLVLTVALPAPFSEFEMQLTV